MKNLDEARHARPRRSVEDRTFVIGGETFVARDRFRPDVIAPIEQLADPVFDPTTCRCSHRLHEHPSGPCTAVGCTCPKFNEALVEAGATLADQLAAFDSAIVGILEGDGPDRWRELRARDDDPIELSDMMEVIRYATSREAARPTGPPGGSSSTPSEPGTSSTDVSSSPDSQAA